MYDYGIRENAALVGIDLDKIIQLGPISIKFAANPAVCPAPPQLRGNKSGRKMRNGPLKTRDRQWIEA